MKEFVFFIHTHKCAGTSIIDLFAENKPFRMCKDWSNNGAMPSYLQKLKSIDSYEELERSYDREQIKHFFAGLKDDGINFAATEWVVPEQQNLPFDKEHFYFTVMRDPFKRYLSNYYFDKERGYCNAPDLYSYRDKSMFRRYNYFTRLFSSRLVKDDSPVTENDYQKAVSLLKKLDAIIILEQPETLELLDPTGVDITKMRRKNVTDKQQKDYPSEFKDFFMKRAKWDYMLYEEAKKIASDKIAENRATFSNDHGLNRANKHKSFSII